MFPRLYAESVAIQQTLRKLSLTSDFERHISSLLRADRELTVKSRAFARLAQKLKRVYRYAYAVRIKILYVRMRLHSSVQHTATVLRNEDNRC